MSGMDINLMTARLLQAKAILCVVTTQLDEPDSTRNANRILTDALWGVEDVLDDVSKEIGKRSDQ